MASVIVALEYEDFMRIKKVILKNGYKRFKHLTIDLGATPSRIVALVGPNGCGKSSVLDGLLFHHNAHGRLGKTAGRTATYHSMDQNLDYNYQEIEIEFDTGSYSSVRAELASSDKGATLFSFRSPYRYNSELKVNETRATSEIRLNDYGASDASSLDAKMEDNYRRLLATVNDFMDKEDARPSEARKKIIGDLNQSIRNCLNLEIASVGNVEGSRGTIYFKKPNHPKEFDFNVLSSGEKEVVDILLDLYLRRHDYDNSIFLIDEPELHISTSIQSKILIEIDRLIGENCQIWLTTHSIGFLRAMQMELKGVCQIVEFRDEYELASKPFVLKPMKVTAQAWRQLFAVALDDLATLVSPKMIIYCEGRAEPGLAGIERGMDAKVFNTIFGESHPDALFISSGGNNELDQRSTIALAILGKVFPTVDVLVLKDRDMASGKVTDEHTRQLYLKHNPKNHRVLKRYEIENYLYDKEVLKAYCEENALNFDEVAYDDFVTDIFNENVKDATGRIKNICSIVGSVNADVFKVELASYFRNDMAVYSELRDCIFSHL